MNDVILEACLRGLDLFTFVSVAILKGSFLYIRFH